MTTASTVYHYCGAESFFSIVRNGRLWVSDARKTNDRRELEWFKDLALKHIAKSAATGDKMLSDLHLALKVRFELLEDVSDYYVCCFSEKKDSVPQWVAYAIDPPVLRMGALVTPVAVPTHVSSLDAQANSLIQASLSKSETFLTTGEYRAAVQEILWLLETISTAFQGAQYPDGDVTGKYFSKIIGDLRRLNHGRPLSQVVGWMESVYGYLSSPTGGGIRHGATLNSNLTLTEGEARLYCDLWHQEFDAEVAVFDSGRDTVVVRIDYPGEQTPGLTRSRCSSAISSILVTVDFALNGSGDDDGNMKVICKREPVELVIVKTLQEEVGVVFVCSRSTWKALNCRFCKVLRRRSQNIGPSCTWRMIALSCLVYSLSSCGGRGTGCGSISVRSLIRIIFSERLKIFIQNCTHSTW
ncbi:hypothetical protein [Burkholderia pseudomallei]|uniref:hypothetical protein n=1 Tax=Burkholderia pseudomallei TaxID=28450 RepID=UPI001FB90759|nr:hypothetical protein [Burkholderia pseudomallei]